MRNTHGIPQTKAQIQMAPGIAVQKAASSLPLAASCNASTADLKLLQHVGQTRSGASDR
jgi:hypothetical protein